MSDISLIGNKVIAAIEKIQKLIMNPAEFINIKTLDNKLVITAVGDLFKGEIRVDVNCKKGIKFGVNALTFTSICKKRDLLNFVTEKNNATVTFSDKKGKYTGSFNTVPYTATSILEDKMKNAIALDSDIKNLLLTTIPKVSLKSVHGDTNMTVMIRIKDKRLKIIVADNFHVAIHNEKIKNNIDLQLDLPIGYMKTISEIGEESDDINIASDNSNMYIWNKNISVALPHISAPANINFDNIVKRSDTFKVCENIINIESEKLRTILDNLSGIHEEGSSVLASIKKTLQLEIKTGYGKIKDSLSGKIEKSDGRQVSLEIYNIDDIVSHLSGEIKVKFHGDNITVFETSDKKSNTIYYSVNMGK